MEVNAYRRGMGNILKDLYLVEYQNKNRQQNKGSKNPTTEEIGYSTT